MLLFWKLVDEIQMGNPRDHAARDIWSKFSIFLPLRAIYFIPYHYETPCIMKIFLRLLNQVHDQNDEMKFLKALLSAEHAKLANFWSHVLQICTAIFLWINLFCRLMFQEKFYAQGKVIGPAELEVQWKFNLELNPYWHELWKQVKCSSLAPPRSIFIRLRVSN